MNEVQKKSVNGAGCEAERHERSELPERSFFYVVSGAILFYRFPFIPNPCARRAAQFDTCFFFCHSV